MSLAPVEADLVVVGAGSAGCVLASRLSEDPDTTVLLVEAGGEPADPRIAEPAAWPLLQGSAIDWDFRTVRQPHAGGRPHPWPRGKVVGGSSAIHAMGHMRGHPKDFDAWVDAGADGWGWNDLLPYFQRSETSPFAGEDGYGDTGPLSLMQPDPPHPLTEAHRAAGAELGLRPLRDHNGPDRMDGPTLNTLSIRAGKRVSAADAYLTPAVRARRNLTIVTEALVDRVAFDGAGRAIGIDIRRGGATQRLSGRRGIILAAGSIGTPMILMRSGLGPGETLASCGIEVRADLPGVGANLQDHLLSAGNLYRAARPVPPTGTQNSESLTYIHADGQTPEEAPDLVVGCVTAPVVSEALAETVEVPAFGAAYTLLFGVTHPRSRGHLAITSPDPAAPPRIDPAYLSEEIDRRRMLEALGWARRLGASQSYAPWRAEEVLPRPEDTGSEAALLDFALNAAWSHHHPVGTCRMGRVPGAVVAPDLACRWAERLWICDTSVFPTLTTGPVNAAVLAVAERGAVLIAGR